MAHAAQLLQARIKHGLAGLIRLAARGKFLQQLHRLCHGRSSNVPHAVGIGAKRGGFVAGKGANGGFGQGCADRLFRGLENGGKTVAIPG